MRAKYVRIVDLNMLRYNSRAKYVTLQ